MLPHNPWLSLVAGLVLTLIPIATTYPGVTVPPWVGLGLALMSAAAAYLLKMQAPAEDVHKDSELPLPPLPPTGIDPALLTEALADYQRRKHVREQIKIAGQEPTLVTRPPEWVEGEQRNG